MKENYLFYVAGVAMVLSFLVPQVAKIIATDEEIDAPNGIDNLTPYQQLIHVFIRDKETPLPSAIFLAVHSVLIVLIAGGIFYNNGQTDIDSSINVLKI